MHPYELWYSHLATKYEVRMELPLQLSHWSFSEHSACSWHYNISKWTVKYQIGIYEQWRDFGRKDAYTLTSPNPVYNEIHKSHRHFHLTYRDQKQFRQYCNLPRIEIDWQVLNFVGNGDSQGSVLYNLILSELIIWILCLEYVELVRVSNLFYMNLSELILFDLFSLNLFCPK